MVPWSVPTAEVGQRVTAAPGPPVAGSIVVVTLARVGSACNPGSRRRTVTLSGSPGATTRCDSSILNGRADATAALAMV